MSDAQEAFEGEVARLDALGCNEIAYVPARLGPATAGVAADQGLLLLLAKGPAFGAETPFLDRSRQDPFDERVRVLIEPLLQLLRARWDERASLVYPSATSNVPLLKWLTAARRFHPSRLGIGIRPDCGTWFAVRAAVCTRLSDAASAWLEARYPPVGDVERGPCSTCTKAPCRDACPVGAISETLDLEKCLTHRLAENSPCALQCPARLACPVGDSQRYPDAQVAYHYDVSLKMLRRWRSG